MFGLVFVAWKHFGNPPEIPPLLLYGVNGASVVAGLIILLGCFVEIFRSYEFQHDSTFLWQVSQLGPLRRRSRWPLSAIAGTVLRRGFAASSSRLYLVLKNNRSALLLTERPTAALLAIHAEMERLLGEEVAGDSQDAPPLGGGLRVWHNTDHLEIVAAPISPRLVPGGLYTLGFAAVYIHPLVTLLGVVMIWQVAQRIGQVGVLVVASLAQAVVLAAAGLLLRRWIRAIARRSYQIVVDNLAVTVVRTFDADAKTDRIPLVEIREIRRTAIVSEESSRNEARAMIERLELISGSRPPTEILYGRPSEETSWLADCLGQRFGLSGNYVP